MPTRHQFSILKQIVDLIPRKLVGQLATKHGVDGKSRGFKAISHVVSMLFAQLSHALSLNDVCDTMRNHAGAVAVVRGASPPSRNGLSHANRERNADMAEALFWETLASLQKQAPNFGMGRNYVGVPRRFKRLINVVDSSTIQLVANCMDWAKHRRRKAAAKCHMRLDLQTFLPRFAIVKAGNTHDSKEAEMLCADMRDGEVVVFDKAYEVNGKDKVMSFITNNTIWASSSICDLYKARWGIEVFFKQIKQTLQLADFLGHNENAVRWQIWTALLTYILLRFIAFMSKWTGSFARLFTILRGTLWSRLDMYSVLADCCGTATGPPRMCAVPHQAYLPGFALGAKA